MTNMARLYEAMTAYQRARAAARDAYMAVMKPLETARGSQYYNEQRDKAAKARNDAVAAAQVEARAAVDAAIGAMRDAVNGRKMQPPTDEQLRILQMLKMRDVVTRAEMDAAANAMDGNGSALAVLDEMARRFEAEHTHVNEYGMTVPDEYYGNYTQMATRGMSTADGLQVLRNLTKACADRINDTVGAARTAVIGAKYNERNTGKAVNLDDLPQATIADNERDFYAGMLNTPYDVLTHTLNADGQLDSGV